MIVALLTCDRYEYTRQTVESLLAHNDVSGWSLYYADDASTDPRIRPYVESQGFVPLVLHKERKGCSPTTEKLVQAIAERHSPDEVLLYLQNDFESVRPLPLTDIAGELAKEDAAFVQLSYRKPRNSYNRRLKFYWPDDVPWAFGDTTRGEYVYTHPGGGLGYHPAVALIPTWVSAVYGVRQERNFRGNVIHLGRRICRTVRPVMRHIGARSTINGLYGKRRKNARQRVGQATYSPVSEPEPARPVTKRTAMQAGATLCLELASLLRPGMRTLECGSGLSTWLFFAAGCDHTSLEHIAKFAPPLSSVRICPLTGEPAWYDWAPEGRYDLILIDGPPGPARNRRGRVRPGRRGILRVIDSMIHPQTVVLLDDTNRAEDSHLAGELASRLGFARRDVPAKHPYDFRKQFTVLNG